SGAQAAARAGAADDGSVAPISEGGDEDDPAAGDLLEGRGSAPAALFCRVPAVAARRRRARVVGGGAAAGRGRPGGAAFVTAMMRPGDAVEVYLYRGVVDMRKSIDGLSAIVEQELGLSPFAAKLFVFCNRRRDKIKVLYWERAGFVLWYKRLEKQRFP